MRICIDFHVEANFVHIKKKYHHVSKWDVSSTVSMETWNSTRRIAMLVNYQAVHK